MSVGHIPPLAVSPAYQGRGIGSELVRRMQDRLGYLFGIDLLCDPDMRPYYECLGMKAVTGMVIRNRDRALE